MNQQLSTSQYDRAVGALVGLACGDALGAPHEFKPPVPLSQVLGMTGGGGFRWAPGEWTDDTSMAVVIAQVVARNPDLLSESAQDAIVAGWIEWARTAPDVGIQTSAVLSSVGGVPTAFAARTAARAVHESAGRSAGNGSLMRTAPVALAYLHDPEDLSKAARAISELTHWEADAGDACVLWCQAIRVAIVNGYMPSLSEMLVYLPSDRRALWAERIMEAEGREPHEFANNGWVVAALQAAWSAIHRAKVPVEHPLEGTHPCDHFRIALERAVRAGNDTDTVAAIAGSLLGARWGESAIPAKWRLVLHGYPMATYVTLRNMATVIANPEFPVAPNAKRVWPKVSRMDYKKFSGRNRCLSLPAEPLLSIGGPATLTAPGIQAAVSLCRVGLDDADLPASRHLLVPLIDTDAIDSNDNLEFLLRDTAQAIHDFVSAGLQTAVHCVQAESRTPTVVAAYLMFHHGMGALAAIDAVTEAMPWANPNPRFRKTLFALEPR